MSKRKNTLNDLQEFLKLQASTLVQPKPVVEQPLPEGKPSESETPQVHIQTTNWQEELNKLASTNRQNFYDAIIKAMDSLPNGSKDVLLINTALYLKHGDNWKAAIELYWSNRM